MLLFRQHKVAILTPPRCGTVSIHKCMPVELNEGEQYPHHIELKDVKPEIGPDFLTLCPVRNPWTRVYSYFCYVQEHPEHHYHNQFKDLSFTKYVLEDHHRIAPCSQWAKDCKVRIEFVDWFKTVDLILTQLGIPHSYPQKLNGTTRSGSSLLDYTPDAVDKIRDYYHKDLEYFKFLPPM